MKKNIVIVILGVLVLGFGAFIVSDKMLENKKVEPKTIYEKDNKNEEENSYSNVAGVYTYTSDVLDNLEGNELKARLKLKLYSDGTYIYHNYLMTDLGFMGNYIIKGSNIYLNYMFQLTSGAGVNVVSGKKTLKITSEGNIKDESLEIGKFNLTNVVLEQDSEQLDNEFSSILNNYGISNGAN